MPDALAPNDPGARDPDLRRLLDRIVAAYEPERVYLFGSRAAGTADAGSDYDLLVVVPDDTPAERLSPVWLSETVLTLPVPADVFPCRQGSFERARGAVGTLSHTAATRGRVVYER
ncbi:nucleotidyltransferase domain-containing protein [Rhodospirillum centenum]|uniref:Nucleotidyltransferase, putative n=1 Tax=Rhodospirillum centenum (strain ATCC 51521 / SW) TaxID=414684 RepID=B6IPI6_RHOCS|nr:nucleotidyltransferase domain-containing protein [Rhodospirillum centenum]ACI99688.1 nucleotidyltransferase, putative [Rhodospirillum centenum SW]